MDSVWECKCGNIEYGQLPPEECDSCFSIDSFTQLPQELVEERTKDLSLSVDEDLLLPGASIKTKPLAKTKKVGKSNRLSKIGSKKSKSKKSTKGKRK